MAHPIEERIGTMSFVDSPRCGLGILRGAKLDAEFIHEPTPPGMKMRLYPHQRTILHAMHSLEHRGFLESKHSSRSVRVHTRIGVLAEKLGSGKTVMILALALLPPPQPRPIVSCAVRQLFGGRPIVVVARFPPHHMIRSTIVFVAASVVRQWEAAVADFTNLSSFVITDMRGIRKFASMLGDGSAAPEIADIIIVKNGKISRPIAEYVGASSSYIHTAIAAIAARHCFTRVVYDDFDTVPIPATAAKMNATFTWFVSATIPSATAAKRQFSAAIARPPPSIDRPLISTVSIARNLDLFIIHNTDDFVAKSTQLGRPKFIIHTVANASAKLIGAMEAITAPEIVEMLNAGAIGAAAAKCGIAGTSVADVFRAVLRENYDKYAHAARRIAWIEGIKFAAFAELPPPPMGDEYPAIYHSRHFRDMREIKYNYPGIEAAAAEILAAMRNEIKESARSIERVKTSIADGDCPVCALPLAGDAAIILRCCGKILCKECATQSTNFVRRGAIVAGKCPACRAAIEFADIVFVGEEIDLNDVVRDAAAPLDAKAPLPREAKTKIDTLLEILRGEKTDAETEIEMKSYGLIGGAAAQLPDAPRGGRKFLIFTKHAESLSDIRDEMTAAGIAFESLHGTADQIDAAAARFRGRGGAELNVLLIDGERFSSGLNLQCATDLIFMLKMRDRTAESQIIGRIHRIGRTCRANVRYIQYAHE